MRKSNLFRTGFFTIMILVFATSTSAFVSSDEDAVPEGLSPTAWQQMTAAIDRDRYRLNKDEGSDAYLAPNPAQGLNAVFTQDGFAVSPGIGSGKENAWKWGLQLSSYGYGADLHPVAGVTKMVSNGNRIEYRRGDLTEWYINDHRGLEQGFTLNNRPDGWNASTPLELQMKAMGNLLPEVEKDGKGIIWRDTHGEEVLTYNGLYAHDANGKALLAHMAADRHGVRILVTDHEAIYPITIDPWVQKAKLTAGADGAAHDRFGHSVAISGNTVVVGMPYDNIDGNDLQGSTYVFIKPVGGWATTSAYTAKLTAGDGATGDLFGISVAISGNTVVVGAYGDDIWHFNPNILHTNQGSAYVFEKPESGWITTSGYATKLIAEDGSADDWFGNSVAINGDTVVVGAHFDNYEQGSAYVFEKAGNNWANASQSAKLTASDGEDYDYFGDSVAISGDTVVVGAPNNDVLSQTGFLITDQGSGYVFVKPGGGWADMNQSARLTASDGAPFDNFGNSIAISGDTVVVGAYGDDIGTNESQGSAYVFEKPGGAWTTTNVYTAKLTASDGLTYDWFGISITINGDTVVAGARIDDIGANNDQGSAYVFKKPGEGWVTTNAYATKLMAGDGRAFDYFGCSVAISGDTVVVGAFGDDIGANEDKGSAYLFSLDESFFFPIKSRNGKTTVIYLE